jgi:outer membrane protein OmpA-like peptidoglycan-associated protein
MEGTTRIAALWLLRLLCLLPAALFSQQTGPSGLEDYTRKLQMSPGLVMVASVYAGHNSAGGLIGDYDAATTITDISDLGFGSSWNMTYPANASGHAFARYAQQSHKVSIYAWPEGPPSGYCTWNRLSDAIYADLKAGKETGFEFDGAWTDVSLKKVSEEDLVVLVNERKVKLHTLKGRTPKGWSVCVLDNPKFPLMVKFSSSFTNWIVDSFSDPEASARNLVDQLKQKGIATTHGILFAFNSAELNDQSKPILNALAEYLKGNPAVRMEIEGHTDNVGGQEFNLKLSETRAESVKKYLEQQGGIRSGRLTTAGLGFTQPVASNATAEGRALNRRVIFRELGRQPNQGKK